jgi:hypothetical protein
MGTTQTNENLNPPLADATGSEARERVVEAEGIIAGILYESSDMTIGACRGKAARILGALRAVGWDHESSKPQNDRGQARR